MQIKDAWRTMVQRGDVSTELSTSGRKKSKGKKSTTAAGGKGTKRAAEESDGDSDDDDKKPAAAAAATAATLDAAFCAEQDTTATGACIERGSGVGWGTGQRRDGGKGDARWGWSEREELDETRSNLHPIPRGASGASGARSCRARVRRSRAARVRTCSQGRGVCVPWRRP